VANQPENSKQSSNAAENAAQQLLVVADHPFLTLETLPHGLAPRLPLLLFPPPVQLGLPFPGLPLPLLHKMKLIGGRLQRLRHLLGRGVAVCFGLQERTRHHGHDGAADAGARALRRGLDVGRWEILDCVPDVDKVALAFAERLLTYRGCVQTV
jgi:hypothetical protein